MRDLPLYNALITHWPRRPEDRHKALGFANAVKYTAREQLRPFRAYYGTVLQALQKRPPAMRWRRLGVAVRVTTRNGEPLAPEDLNTCRGKHLTPTRRDNRQRYRGAEPIEILEVDSDTSTLFLTSQHLRGMLYKVAIRGRNEVLRLTELGEREWEELRQVPIELVDIDEAPGDDPALPFFERGARDIYLVPEQAFQLLLERPGRELERTLKRYGRRQILRGSARNRYIVVDGLPQPNTLVVLRPQTYVVRQQEDAISRLSDIPHPAHRPLLQLFAERDKARWQPPAVAPAPQWRVLTQDGPGVQTQREFVQIALATNDFAFLEGPPGSGKTTTIHELILQLLEQDKKVLLCASTHVAVDNVIERLVAQGGTNDIHLVRVGAEDNVKRNIRPFTLEHIMQTRGRQLRKRLHSLEHRQPWQEQLLRELAGGGEQHLVERLVLDTAQLVCGTTIGILQHPAVKEQRRRGRRARNIDEPPFDVLILDEASKTPFPEFLVPALLARRWIIIGDPRQLSPYVEMSWIEAAITKTFTDALHNDVDAALVARAALRCAECFARPRDGALVVGVESEEERKVWLEQAYACAERCNWPRATVWDLSERDNESGPRHHRACAQIAIGSTAELRHFLDSLPLDLAGLEGSATSIDALTRRLDAHKRRPPQTPPTHSATHKTKPTTVEAWAHEVAWRLVRAYELRYHVPLDTEDSGRPCGPELYKKQLDLLLPSSSLLRPGGDLAANIARIGSVALPSILERLQRGDSHNRSGDVETAMSAGLPEEQLRTRHRILRYQRRMDPMISRFPREHIYRATGADTLEDAPNVLGDRGWTYLEKGLLWESVIGGETRTGPKINKEEVNASLRTLERLLDYSASCQRPDGEPWEFAVLTFYTGQERELRERLRQLTGQWGRYRTFEWRRGGRVCARIELCTVDRFQGHEADAVVLSLVRTRGVGFLDSPNRLNVALTRARHLLVIVGNRPYFRDRRHRRRAPILWALANDEEVHSALTFGDQT
ncbi:MAG: hypothetical protein KatS3mg102_0711 [Planctomycetota bacterium]|nr:MAG: hypothetical protein KatS3mg102_0711 [Planctomycetota bacterium]